MQKREAWRRPHLPPLPLLPLLLRQTQNVKVPISASGLSASSPTKLPVKIWESIRIEFTPVVAVAATFMILLAVLLFGVAQALSKRAEKQAG